MHGITTKAKLDHLTNYLLERVSGKFLALITVLMLGVLPWSSAQALSAAAARGQIFWNNSTAVVPAGGGCGACHGTPQANNTTAFSLYGTSVNQLATYASDQTGAAITYSATTGYSPIPAGNTSGGGLNVGGNTATNMAGYAASIQAGTNAADLAAFFAEQYFAAPAAPTGVSASPTNVSGQVSVSFTAPTVVANVNLNIIRYDAICGTKTGSNLTTPVTVGGLTDGTAYTCSVTAINNANINTGTGNAGTAALQVTPVSPPIAPTITSVTPGNAQIIVTFNPSATTGGSAIKSYTATCGATSVTVLNSSTAAGQQITVSPLSNATSYTCTVTATNTVLLTSGASGVSGSVTPQAPPVATGQAVATAIAFNSLAAANTLTPPVTGSVNTPGIVVSTQATHGTATLIAGTNTVSYAPATGYYGPDSFQYTITGIGGTSAPATYNVSVGLPPAPALGATYSTGTTPFAVPFCAAAPCTTSAVASIAPTLTNAGIAASLSPSAGTKGSAVAVNNVASPATMTWSAAPTLPTMTYTPTAGAYGADSFAYSAVGPGNTASTGAGVVYVTIANPPTPTLANSGTALAPVGTASYCATGTCPALTGLTPNITNAAAGAIVTNITAGNGAKGTVSVVNNGTASVSMTYTATAGNNNVGDSFTYTASGPNGTVSGAITVFVNIGPPPAPVATGVAVGSATAITFNTAQTLTPPTSGVVNATNAIALTGAGPAHGVVSLVVGTNNVTYTPASGYYGSDSFQYTATGAGGTSAAGTYNVLVGPPPGPALGAVYSTGTTPFAVSFCAAAPCTSSAVSNIAPNVTNKAAGAIAASLSPSGAVKGTAIAVNNVANPVTMVYSASPTLPTMTYTPTAGQYGTDSFTYTAAGPGNTSSGTTGTVYVQIANPPTPTIGDVGSVASPGATPTYCATAPCTASAATGITAKITNSSSGAIVTNLVPAPAGTTGTAIKGTVTVLNSGTSAISMTYTPNAGEYGADSFTYTASGPDGVQVSPATVYVTIGNPPAPVANAGAALVPYNSSANILTPATTGVVNAAGLAVTVQALHGTATASATNNTITYTPNSGYYGADSFKYTVKGPGGTSTAAATFNVTVGNPPAPDAKSSTENVRINSQSNVITPSFVGVANTAGITVTVNPNHGTATASVTNNTVTYTPNADYYGKDSFGFVVTGPGGTSPAAATVSIDVKPLDTTAKDTTMSVDINSSKTIDVAALNLVGGTAVSGVRIDSQPVHGSASTSGTKLTYTPNKDYFGTDVFTYQAIGAGGNSPSAKVTVTIDGVRPNPLKDARVLGLLNAEAATIKRFGTVQLFNFQQRLESRHHAIYSPSGMSAPATTDGTPAPAGGASPAGQQGRGYFNSWQPGTVLAYENDPNVLVHSAQLGGNTQAAGSSPMYGVLMNAMAGVLTTSTLNLGAVSTVANSVMPNDEFGRVEVWAAGNLRFGTRSQSGTDSKFTTDGISVGADKRIDRKLTLGMGMGYARDKSDIGADGTNSSASGTSVAGYASYMMDSGTFLDALLGYGRATFDTNRYVSSANEFAKSSRAGDQLFGSLSYGYEYRKGSLLLSPYGRFDFSFNRLNNGTETGAGANALNYASQNLRSSHLAFGMRAQSVHQTDFGVVQPHARFEYQRGFEINGQTSVAYADMLDTQYTMAGTSQSTNALVLGFGNTFVMSDTLRLAFDYQRLSSRGLENYQSVNLRFTKTIKGKNDLASLLEEGYDASIAKTTGLTVIGSFGFDDNVSRASEKTDKRSDTIYGLTVNKALSFLPTKFTRLTVSGFLDVEKFRNYAGLDRVSVGAQGEYAYRFSGDFGSPAIGIFARYTSDAYESVLRDGARHSVGVNLRKALTDRINLFAALADNVRTGKSDVFNTRDKSGRMNLDYAVASGQTLYLTGEYRKGDIVSSGRPSLQILDSSIVFVRDDVFTAPWFYDYRMQGKTSLFTLGYNYALGTRDSLDFAWRHVKAMPDKTPSYAAPMQYIDNLFSVSYLMAF